jgi:hypothetical protein
MTLSHRPAARRLPALVVAVLAVAASSPTSASAQAPAPYRDPPFTCEVIDYGREAPTLPAPEVDPLCVRYDKTDITVTTLGAVDFLAAEPGRVALVAGKCSYWQQDHWVVRASPETPPIISWRGSYWYDAHTGSAGGILRDLRIADQPASGEAFIEAMRPLVGDEQADQFRQFVDDGGGGGMSMQLPDGFGVECAAAPGVGPDPAPGEPPATAPSTTVAAPAARPTPNALPATGLAVPGWAFALLAAGALVAAAARRTA